MKRAIETGLNDKIGGAVKESDPALVKDVLGNHDIPRPAENLSPATTVESTGVERVEIRADHCIRLLSF